MNAVQKLKHIILLKAVEMEEIEGLPEVNEENIDDLYDQFYPWDTVSEMREGEVETDVECDWSRHYECRSVAARHPDGSWIGWTYWYGGGKHGNPEEIEWLDHAYFLDVTEEERMVVVRTFTKRD